MGYNQEINVFLNAISGKKQLPVDFKDYSNTTLATFKILESIHTKHKAHIT